jgi:uncharacterized protein
MRWLPQNTVVWPWLFVPGSFVVTAQCSGKVAHRPSGAQCVPCLGASEREMPRCARLSVGGPTATLAFASENIGTNAPLFAVLRRKIIVSPMGAMNITWDGAERRANLSNHGLDFADAQWVFAGPPFTRPDTRSADGEARFSTVGLLGVEAVVIAHTATKDRIHIISMRKAERNEREYSFANL